jgi:YD repeat-containing protein
MTRVFQEYAYNHLGLTKSVTKGSDVLKYTYDATGRRIKKQLNNVAPRWYMDGVECSGDTTMIHTEYGSDTAQRRIRSVE